MISFKTYINEATPTIIKLSIKGPKSYDLGKLEKILKQMGVKYDSKILDDMFLEIEFQNTKDMQKFNKLKDKAK